MARNKAAPAGVLRQLLKACPTFKPESHETVAFYRQQIAEQFHERIADPLGVPRFSPLLMAEIAKKLKNPEAAEILHVAVRIGNFGNRKEQKRQRRDVKRLMEQAGHPTPKTRGDAYGADKFLDCAVPLLMHYGLKLSSNETSDMVDLLGQMAQEMAIPCDPGSKLHRRIQQNRENNKGFIAEIIKNVKLGLEPLRRQWTEK